MGALGGGKWARSPEGGARTRCYATPSRLWASIGAAGTDFRPNPSLVRPDQGELRATRPFGLRARSAQVWFAADRMLVNPSHLRAFNNPVHAHLLARTPHAARNPRDARAMLLMSASPERPDVASRARLPESCRNAARHTHTHTHPEKLPAATPASSASAQQLPNNCRALAPETELRPNFG